MTEEYNSIVAAHYSAYRPPLHQLILRKALPIDKIYESGLDVGCGTGYSAVALTNHCQRVYGIEPSPSMLSKATSHKKITYLPGSGGSIPLPGNIVDLVTFAGSLFYTKNEATVQELKRVCRKGCAVVIYDFEILLEDTLVLMGAKSQESASSYDHAVNLSDVSDFEETEVKSETIELVATASDLAHVLLSSLDRYNAFSEKYGVADPFPVIVRTLEATGMPLRLLAKVYYANYRLR